MQKIVTCCYCATRAALVMRGDGRHELSCAACGAPLHEMKMMPQRAKPAQAAAPRRTRPLPSYPPEPSYERHERHRSAPARPRKRGKRRKGLMHKVFEEVWDVVEDIFD